MTKEPTARLPLTQPPNWPLSPREWSDYRLHRRDAHCHAGCAEAHHRQDRIDSSPALAGWRAPDRVLDTQTGITTWKEGRH